MVNNVAKHPRESVASWDETFLEIAKVVASRSKDPSTQVGACIVDGDNRILSLGYNGTTRGWDDSQFPWGRMGEPLDVKYPYVVHAERNAILNFRGLLREFDGAKIYVTLFPCNECAKEIAQVGIGQVIYECEPPSWDSVEVKASLAILSRAQVVCRKG